MSIQNKPMQLEWTANQDELLGKHSDQKIAGMLNIPVSQVRRRREFLKKPTARSQKWSPEIIQAMQVLTDEQIVEKFKLDVSPDAVRVQRMKRNIPPCKLIHNRPKRKIEWTEKNLAMLGLIPDEEIAEIMQIHKDTVSAKRRMIGKAKFERR